jgi:hypothetical protein
MALEWAAPAHSCVDTKVGLCSTYGVSYPGADFHHNFACIQTALCSSRRSKLRRAQTQQRLPLVIGEALQLKHPLTMLQDAPLALGEKALNTVRERPNVGKGVRTSHLH